MLLPLIQSFVTIAHAAVFDNVVNGANTAQQSLAGSNILGTTPLIHFTSNFGIGDICNVSGEKYAVPDGRFLACYISSLYTFFVRGAILLAVLMITIGGFRWLLAVGDVSKIKESKEIIIGAITGLVLALISYLIFAQINDNLVNLQAIDITPINLSTPSSDANFNFKTYSNEPEGYCQLSPVTPIMTQIIPHNIKSEQLQTFHPSLVQIMTKLDGILAQNKFGKIYLTSVTDDQIWTPPKPGAPLCMRERSNIDVSGSCQHNVNSYHYGGPSNRCIFNAEHPPVSCAVDLADPLGGFTEGFYTDMYHYMQNAGFDYIQCETKTSHDSYPCSLPGVNHIHGELWDIKDADNPDNPRCYSVIKAAPSVDTSGFSE